ncbi:LPXTG cell wall anchor domain-containing protein [Staphylococcus caeli]|uniref:LPXTG cell wall anchor domain-containing protein n=1 Tax=Staphylococcus caeli TaxID=2201815 RepID=UPI003CC90FC2
MNNEVQAAEGTTSTQQGIVDDDTEGASNEAASNTAKKNTEEKNTEEKNTTTPTTDSSNQKDDSKVQALLALKEKQEQAKKKLHNMMNLSDNQRLEFIDDIKKVNSESEIDPILINAQAAEDKARQEAEEKAKQEANEQAEQEAEDKAKQEEKTEQSSYEEIKQDSDDETKQDSDDKTEQQDTESAQENDADTEEKTTNEEATDENKLNEDKSYNASTDDKNSEEAKEETTSNDKIKDTTENKEEKNEADSDEKKSAEQHDETLAKQTKNEDDKTKDKESKQSTEKETKQDIEQQKAVEKHVDKNGDIDTDTKKLVDELADVSSSDEKSTAKHYEETIDKADAGQKEMLVNAMLNSNLDSEQVEAVKENLDIDYNKASSKEILDAVTAEALKQAQEQRDLYQPAAITNSERTTRQRTALRSASTFISRAAIQTLAVTPPQNNTDYKDLASITQVNNNNNISTKNFTLTVDQVNVTYLKNGQIRLRFPVSTPKGLNLGFNAKTRLDIGLSDSMKKNIVSVKNLGEDMAYDSATGTYYIEKDKAISVTAEGNELDVEIILNAQDFKASDKVEIRYNRRVNLGLTAIDKSAVITFDKLSAFLNKQKAINDQIQQFDTATDDEKLKLLTTVNNANTDATLTSATASVLSTAKEIGKSRIDGLTDLSNNDKAVFKTRIQDAKTLEEIDTIVNQATDSNQTSGLNKAKAAANTQIDALTNLTPQEKTNYKNQVNNSTDKSNIPSVVQSATRQDKANALSNAKTAANNTVDGLTDLTPEEKTAFKDRINKATDISQIQPIVVEAQTKQTQNQLTNLKNEAIKSIDALTNLSDAEKTNYKNNVQSATTEAGVQSALTSAQAKDTANALAKAKEDAIKQIDSLTDLPEAEKTDFINRINNVTNVGQIQPIVDSANARNDLASLNKAKADANTQIDNLTNLTDQQKTEYKNRIAGTTTPDQIQTVINNTKIQDAKNALEKAKVDAKDTIASLANLTDDERNIYNSQIDQATTQEAVQQIVEQARQGDQSQLLNNVKSNAKNSIDGMASLTDEQKADLKTRVDNATDEAAVSDIVDEAKSLNQTAELDKLRKDANAKIDTFENLTPQEVSNFKDRINNANDTFSINSIVSEARIKNDENTLTNTKNEAKTAIDALDGLTSEEKDSFKSQVDKAQIADNVAAIVKQAENANATNNLNKAKEEATNTINGIEGLNEEEKAAFISQVDDAKDATSIDEVVNEAKAQAQENNLNDARQKAEEIVRGLDGLSVDEVSDFVNQIKGADNAEAIQKIVDQATEDSNNHKLDDAKSNAINKVNAMQNLTPEELEQFTNDIQNAKDVESVNDIVQQAQDKANENTLNIVRENGKETVNNLPNLSEEEKAAFIAEIDAATRSRDVGPIIDKANDLNDQYQLEKAKASAKDEIKELLNLTDGQSEDFINQVENAENSDEILAIVDQAKEQEKNNVLEEGKREAIEIIKGLDGLTDEEKNEFIDIINAEQQPENIEGTIEIAKEYASLNIAIENGINELEEIKGLSSEDIDGFKEAIENAQSKEEIDEIIKEANDLAKSNGLDALKAAQAQGNAINEGDYTPNSYAPLKDALTAAQNIIDNPDNHTQAEIDEATQTIQDALNQLSDRADKAELDAAIKEAEGLDLDNNDAEDKAVADALARAQEVSKDDNATAEEVKTATDALNAAMKAKETQDASDKKAASLDALKAAQAQGNAINEGEYTPNSYAPLKDALTAAQNIIDNPEDHTQVEIDEATTAIQDALDQLSDRADKAELDAAISEAEGLDLDNNDAEDKAVADALARAQEVSKDDNATAEEVKTATDALNAAMKAKETQDASDKKAASLDALKAAQAQGNAINEGDYTPNSYAPLKDALTAAQNIIDNPEDHTQAEIDEATQTIQDALDQLSDKADKAELDAAISEAEGLDLDNNDTEDKAVADALARAQEVSKDDNATAEEVKTATDALNAAMKAKDTQDASDKKTASLDALKAAQAQGNAIDEDGYTPNSYAPLKDALTAAQNIIDNPEDHTQAEIDEATTAIQDALDQLSDRADKAELDAAIKEAEGLDLDETDAEDKAVIDALARAQEVSKDDNATAEEVKTATDALNAAMKAKETQDASDKKAASLDALKAAQAQGNAINEGDYTPNSYAPLKDALTAAQNIIDNPDNHTQAEIDEATTAIQDALDQLSDKADKTELDAAIKEAEGLDLDETDAEDKAVIDALATAKEVSENGNATAEEVKTATDALNAAMKAKETQDASDKKAASLDALKAAQAQGNAINEGDYTPNSYAPLKDALTAAQNIIDNPDNHTQAEIDEATTAIQDALDQLSDRADKAELDAAISEAEGLDLDNNDAEDKAVIDALATAKEVSENGNATAEEVKTATDALNTAMKAKETQDASDKKAASLDALKAAQAQGNAINEGDYTPNSYAPLKDALTAAQNIIDNPDNHTQAEIDEATTAIQDALDQLSDRADKAELDAAISEAEGLDLDNNDTEGKAVADALARAQEVSKDDNATAEEVKTATDALNAAMKAKESQDASDKKAASLDALKAAQAQGNAINEGDYTPNSYAPLKDALTAAQNIIDNPEDHTQAEIDEATTAIQDALNQLSDKADKTELDAAIKEAEGLDLDETDAEDKAVADALARAQEVSKDDDATAEEVKTATVALNAAMKAKDTQAASDKKAASLDTLKAAQAQGNAINEGDYTPNSYAPLKDALTAAQNIIDNPDNHTQAEIDEATQTIQDALNQLSDKADKTELDAAISEAEGLDLDNNDAEDKAVADALARSQEVSKDDNATAEEVKTATDALNAAMKAKKTQDSSDLSSAKEKAKSLVEKLESITDKQKDNFVDRIENASSIDEIDKIVEEAKTKDLEMHALNESKKQGFETINDLPGLTNSDRTNFIERINQSETIENVEEIVKEAIEKSSASELEKAKALAKQEIDGLIYLSDEAKAGYKDQIDKAKTQAEIDEIVKAAENENKAEHQHGGDSTSHNNHGNKPTDNANGSHQGSDNTNGSHLVTDNSNEHGTANHDNGSSNTSGITIDHSSIDKAKEEAKQYINQLRKLSEQQQGEFNQRIENAETVQKIQDIVDEASVVNNHLPDTGIEDNNSKTIFGSVVAFLAGLLLLRRRKDKKNE